MVGGRADGVRSFEPPAARPSEVLPLVSPGVVSPGVVSPGVVSPGVVSPGVVSPGVVSLWGVLNVTPDSFSDGGQFLSPADAVARAKAMLLEGADVLDVGGASSRPRGLTYGAGAEPVPAAEERARIEPVISVLARELGARVSVDTTQPDVARAALGAGASIVNDVSMGASEALLRAVADHGAELVLMHTRGDGSHGAGHTQYADVALEVRAELARAVDRAIANGVAPERIWIDPGIGFAKTAEQSAALLARLPELVSLGHRVLVGASRKAFIAALAPRPDGTSPPTGDRLGGSLAVLTLAALGGASAVRVHDVAASYQALRVIAAVGARSVSGGDRG